MILWYLDNIMTLAVCICCIAVIWYYLQITLVDLQSQCTGEVSEPVNICLGKVLKKSLNMLMTKEGEPCMQVVAKNSILH